MKTIIGIDPGLSAIGYGIIKIDKNKVIHISHGVIRTTPHNSIGERLKKINDELIQIIEQHNPQIMAIEDVFYSQNIKVAIKMGHVRGVVLLAAVNHSISIFEYSPREVKLAVTGNGNASKQQVQRMVVQLFRLPQSPLSYDITDAMAVAICHCNRIMRTKNII